MNLLKLFTGPSGRISSRRLFGAIGFISCIVAIFMGIQHPLLEGLLWASVAMFGLTTADGYINKKTGGEGRKENV